MSVVPQLALKEVPQEVMGAMISDPVVGQLQRRVRKLSARNERSLIETPRQLEQWHQQLR
jgi:hypothetical protein